MLKQVLNEGRFSRFRANDTGGPARPVLLARLSALQASGMADSEPLEDAIQAGGDITPCARDANVLYFCDRIFEECELHSDLEPSLLARFRALRPVLAGFLLTHDEALHALQHPLFDLLDQLWQAARYWSPELGKQGDKYRARLEDNLLQLQQADPATAPFAEWHDTFVSQWQKDMQRATLLATRICETERGTLAGKNAEQVVRRQVNALLSRTDMPAVVERLLKEPFHHSLQMIYLSHGAASEQWQSAVFAMESLQDSFLAPQNDEDKQRSYKLIPIVPDLVRNALVSIADPAELETWLEEIEALHMRILLDHAVELQAATVLPSLSDDSSVNTQVSEALLEQVALIPVGRWIIYQRDNGDAMRCKLVLKLDDAGQLLFVNVLGVKCLEKTFEELAYLLSVRQVRLMDEDNSFSQILQDAASQLIQLYEKQSLLQANVRERDSREAERRRQAQEKARQEAEALERERREAEQRQAQLAQQLEAQRKAAAAAEAAAHAEQHQAEAQLAQREATLQLARSLGVGAWVEMSVGGVRQKCKLAAVINATDKLIFTNREGKKVLEPKRDELVNLLLDGSVVVIETGSQFESSLQKVIKSMRTD